MSDDERVELLRSRYDGKTLAICVNGILHGPDLGPWEIIWSRVTDERIHEDFVPFADVVRVLRAATREKTGPVDELKEALHALFSKHPRLREETER